MKNSSNNNKDIIEFKEEIMKHFQILENNFKSEYTSKFSKINSNFDQMELKLNTLSHNNDSLLDLISKQNFNFEKLNNFQSFENKANQTLLTQEIQLKNILEEISRIKNDIHKITTENLILPGSIGPGAVFKNLSEYLVYQMDEFNKLRIETSQNKKKVADWDKTAMNTITNTLFKFQSHYNNKHKQIYVLKEKNKSLLNNKILDLETKFERYQNKIDKLVKQMENEIQIGIENMNKENNKNMENFENKVEEFKLKLDVLTKEFKINNNKIKFKTNRIKKENSIPSHFQIENESLNNCNKSIIKLSKNLFPFNFDIHLPNKGISKKLNPDDEKNNNSVTNNSNNNNDFKIYSDNNSPKRKYFPNELLVNESKNNNKENNLPILSEKKSRNYSNINGNNSKNLKTIKRNNEINSNDNFKTLNSLTKLTKENTRSEKNIKYNDKNKSSNSLEQNNEQKADTKIIKSNNIINNEKNILYNDNKENHTGIERKIDSKEIQKDYNKQINTMGNIPDIDKINNQEDEMYISLMNDVNSQNNQNKENIGIQKNFSSNSSEFNSSKIKDDFNNNNKNNIINSKNILTRYRGNNNISSIKNKKINMQMNINIEQQKIMSKIREYYDNRKIQIEKKSNQKLVECNLINLNMRNSCENIHRRNNSHFYQRNSFDTLNNQKIKIDSSYRKTNYKFYSKRDKYSAIRSFNSSFNKEKK